MPALVAGIHVFLLSPGQGQTWMAGTSLDKPGHDDRIGHHDCRWYEPGGPSGALALRARVCRNRHTSNQRFGMNGALTVCAAN
jgi:hypothetical protein